MLNRAKQGKWCYVYHHFCLRGAAKVGTVFAQLKFGGTLAKMGGNFAPHKNH